MRTYVYNGSWTEFQNGGPEGPPVSCENILSGIGSASIPVPSYEGSALATWQNKQFDRIQIKDNTATRVLWEGYVDYVHPTRTGVLLSCLEPQARLARLTAGAWADFELDHGIITSIEGVGDDELHDSAQDWTTDEWNTPHGRGILITGLPPSFRFIRNEKTDILANSYGNPVSGRWVGTGDLPANTIITEGVIGMEEYDYWQTDADPTELATLNVDYHLKIAWTGSNPGAKLQIEKTPFDKTTWEDIVSSFSSGVIERGTHPVTGSESDYVNSAGEICLRLLTVGGTLDYTWYKHELTVHGTWTDEYNGSLFVVGDTIAKDQLTVASGSLETAHVQVGDQYRIGERLDVILDAIESNETTGFDAFDVTTSGHYMHRTFEHGYCLEILRACQDMDRAEWWNDVSSSFTLKYDSTFDVSGVEINETNIDTNGIEGGYAAENIVNKIIVWGDPETGIVINYEWGSYTAGDPVRSLYERLKKTKTELFQLGKAIVDERAGTAPFVGRFRFTKTFTALESLMVGQTVNLKIDMNANASDDIDEDNVLVRKITRSQTPTGRLETTIEVGIAPLKVNEGWGKPSDHPRLDRGFELHRDREIDRGAAIAKTLSAVPAPSAHGPFGGLRNAPLDFTTDTDAHIKRGGVTKLLGTATDIDLGTDAVDEDVNIWGDMDGGTGTGINLETITIDGNTLTSASDFFFYCGVGDQNYFDDEVDISGSVDCSDDGDFGDDVLFGTNVFVLEDDGTGNAKITATDGLQVEASGGDPYLVLAQDGTNFAIIQYDDSDGKVDYRVYDASVLTDHRFSGDITAYTGDINIVTNTKKLLFTGSNQQIGTSTGNYPEYVYADKLRWKTDHTSFDDLDDLQIIMDMHQDGREVMPPLIMDGDFVDPAKESKLVFGAIRQLKRENRQLKREIEDLKHERS